MSVFRENGRCLGGAGWWKVKGEGSMWGEENVMSVTVEDEFQVNAKGIHNNNSELAWDGNNLDT